MFGAAGADGKGQLWVRALDSLNALQLANTEGASFPFWSADSRFVGFFADGKLKKIDVAGGFVSTLCPAPAARGGTWSQEGVIVFAPDNSGPLHRVLAAGGSSSPVTTSGLSIDGGRLPIWRPDGKELFYLGQDGMLMAAEVNVKGPVLGMGAVRSLFGIRGGVGYTYDVALDGQSFLVRTVSVQTSSEPLTLIRNWTASLKK